MVIANNVIHCEPMIYACFLCIENLLNKNCKNDTATGVCMTYRFCYAIHNNSSLGISNIFVNLVLDRCWLHNCNCNFILCRLTEWFIKYGLSHFWSLTISPFLTPHTSFSYKQIAHISSLVFQVNILILSTSICQFEILQTSYSCILICDHSSSLSLSFIAHQKRYQIARRQTKHIQLIYELKFKI